MWEFPWDFFVRKNLGIFFEEIWHHCNLQEKLFVKRYHHFTAKFLQICAFHPEIGDILGDQRNNYKFFYRVL